VTEVHARIAQAREAMAREAWAEAYDAFRAVDPSSLFAEDLEGLADAAWWTSRFEDSLDARQRAYAAHAAGEDERAAGVAAARLAIEHFVRENPSVGTGYLMRAQRHLRDLPACDEQGFLAMVESNVARFAGEIDRAIASARRATEIAERFHDRDLAAMAIHSEGLALVDAGRIEEGLALMDEAMTAVLGGDLSPYFTGIIYCNLIQACLEVNDIGRAGEWSDAARRWCDALQPEAPFPGMCRVNRAEVARLRGAWPEAETEAEAVIASRGLAEAEPQLAAAAFVQIGEIRRRTGDAEGAEAAFARATDLGSNAQPGLALLRLAQGRTGEAGSGLRMVLASEHQPARRARLLAAQVEVALSAGRRDEALAAVEELTTMARETASLAFTAVAETAAGALALAQADPPAALERLRRACSGWRDLKLPYEAARARMLCAQAMRAGGDEAGAATELRTAAAEFERLGAAPDASEAAELLRGPRELPGGLTPREAEVLRLVAAGNTNRDIAVELVISEHTVARHLQNMFAKLGVSSRSAATAYAFEHGLA
jgi:ATP/maltotriose-dependent transcriptional regulator MalT